MIQEYYRQMRKFGCNILAVVQQYDVLKASEVRGAVLGNSKMFLKLKFPTALRCVRIDRLNCRFHLPDSEGESSAARLPATGVFCTVPEGLITSVGKSFHAPQLETSGHQYRS
jgi:hypothetical protein